MMKTHFYTLNFVREGMGEKLAAGLSPRVQYLGSRACISITINSALFCTWARHSAEP